MTDEPENLNREDVRVCSCGEVYIVDDEPDDA